MYININNNPPKYNSTVLIRQNGGLLFTIEVTNVSTADLGDYTGIIYGDIYGLTSWCSEYRYSFFPSFWHFIIMEIPTVILFTSLEIYSKWMHEYLVSDIIL